MEGRPTTVVTVSVWPVLRGMPSTAKYTGSGKVAQFVAAGHRPRFYVLPSGTRFDEDPTRAVEAVCDAIEQHVPPDGISAKILPCVQPALVWSIQPLMQPTEADAPRCMMVFDLDHDKKTEVTPGRVDVAAVREVLLSCVRKFVSFEVPEDEPVVLWLGEFNDKPVSMHAYFPHMTIDPRSYDAMQNDKMWEETNAALAQWGLAVDGKPYSSGLKWPFMDKSVGKVWRGDVQRPVLWPFSSAMPTIREAMLKCIPVVPPDSEWYDRAVLFVAPQEESNKRSRNDDGSATTVVRVDGDGPWLERLFAVVEPWRPVEMVVKDSNYRGGGCQLVVPRSRYCPMKRDEHGHPQCYVLVAPDGSMTVKCQGDHCNSISIPSVTRVFAVDEKESVIDFYNKQYAVGPCGDGVGTTVKVWQFAPGKKPVALRVDDFRLLHSSDLHYVPDPRRPGKTKEVLGPSMWLRSPHHRVIEGVMCDPDGVPPGYINTYPGIPPLIEGYEFAEGESLTQYFPKWYTHVQQNICGGVEEYLTYTLNWCAWLVQKPGLKPRVALLLSGEQGEGKNSFFGVFEKILGRGLYVQVSDAHQIGARFNGQLQYARLVVYDEAVAKGKEAMGVVKALITEPMMEFEVKYGARKMEKSFSAVIFATNSLSGVTADPSERRLFALDVAYRLPALDRSKFFRELAEERQETRALAAIYRYLMNRDISEFVPDRVPRTLALWRQKYSSLPSAQRWWFNVLCTGVLTEQRRTGAGGVSFQLDAERELTDMEETVQVDPFGRYMSRQQLVRACRAYTGENVSEHSVYTAVRLGLDDSQLKRRQLGPRGKRQDGWVMPSLQVCREAFAKAVQQEVDIFEREAERRFGADTQSLPM